MTRDGGAQFLKAMDETEISTHYKITMIESQNFFFPGDLKYFPSLKSRLAL